MSKQLTRAGKIKLLQAMKEGKISPEGLRPPQIYIFNESNLKPGVYEHKGKEYNETEYKEFCNELQRRNNGSIIWNESRSFVNANIVVTIKYRKNNLPNKIM